MKTSMRLPEFETAISESERPQTYALDGTATGIGKINSFMIK
jgi:hypothetical protein